eukprot:GHVT01072882.1.p1 GENE.GHVT01072882.1~~GHVT01072882.1.p1  ORF type:complete len:173 (+),score=24.63 GHVT01072882.1:30-521(+)
MGNDLLQMHQAVYNPNSTTPEIPNCTAHPVYDGPLYGGTTLPGYSMFGSSSSGNAITESSITQDPVTKISNAVTFAIIGTLVAVVLAVLVGTGVLLSVKRKKRNFQDALNEMEMNKGESSPLFKPVSENSETQEGSSASKSETSPILNSAPEECKPLKGCLKK